MVCSNVDTAYRILYRWSRTAIPGGAAASMIWPANLVNCALFNTLHSQQYAGIGTRGGLSRERFFVYWFSASFFWCE